MAELSDADVFGGQGQQPPVGAGPQSGELSDDHVFGNKEMSDENVFGSQAPQERTWGQEIGRDLRTGARAVLPTTAGIIGGFGAAGLAAETGPGAVVAGLVGGAVAGAAAQAAQNRAADWLGIDSEESRQADAANPSIGSTVAEFAPAALTLQFGGIETTLAKRVLSGGIMGAVDLGTQAVTKGPSNIDPTEALTAVGTGAVLPNARPWAARTSGALTGAIQGALGRGGAPAEQGAAGSAGAANGEPPTAGRPDNNPNAEPQTQPGERPHSPVMTPSVAGSAVDHARVPGVADSENPGDGLTNTGGGFQGKRGDFGRDGRKLPNPASQTGIPGAPTEPLVQSMGDDPLGDPAIKSAMQGQQEVMPNDQAAPQQAPQAPQSTPPAPEPGAPAPEQAPQAPRPDLTLPEDGSIPDFLKRGPKPAEPVQQQAQQPQPPKQGAEESNDEFAARVKAAQAQSAQNAPGGRQQQAPNYTPAEAVKKLEELSDIKGKDLPPAAQKVVDVASERANVAPLRTRNAIDSFATKTLGKVFSPGSVSEAGNRAEAIIRQTGGERQRNLDWWRTLLPDELHAVVNNMTSEAQLDFQKAMDTGGKVPFAPGLEKIAKPIQESLAKDRAYIDKTAKDGYIDPVDFVNDYMPRQFKKPEDAVAFLADFNTQQGSSRGLKARTFPTLQDALDWRGPNGEKLELKNANPIDAVSAYKSATYKFIQLQKILKTGLRQDDVSFTQKPGWVELEGAGQKGKSMYADPDWARLFNDYYSPGLHGDERTGAIFDAIQPASNLATSAMMGFSAYHPFTMLHEAMASKIASAGSLAASGDIAGSLKRLAKAAPGLSAYDLYKQGKDVSQEWLQPGSMGPELGKVVDLYQKANGRALGHDDPTMKFSAMNSVWDAYRRGTLSNELQGMKDRVTDPFTNAKTVGGYASAIAGTPFRAGHEVLRGVGAVLNDSVRPMFNHAIPMLKNGAFKEMVGDWLKANPNATDPEAAAFARRASNEIDNRFGLMVQDNIMWNKTMKQSAQVALFSYGWLTGTIRTIGGGAIRGIMHPSRIAVNSIDHDPSAAYALIALPLSVAMINTAYQYLKTGEAPKDAYDLMAGRTGGTLANGQPERALTPGYQKDVYGWIHNSPSDEMYNKLNPLFKTVMELTRNQGWVQTEKGPRYGPIADKSADAFTQLKQYLGHVVQAFEPISAQNLTQQRNPKEKSNISMAERATAIRNAPAWINPGGNPAETARIHREFKQTHPGQ